VSVYDALAPSFDQLRTLPPGVPAAIRRAVLACASAARPRLLDLGCGSGRMGAALVDAGDHYVGVDLSLGMLLRFATRAPPIPLLVQASGDRLPFRDAEFDIVLLVQVLSAAADWRPLVTEASRVLRRQGALIFGRTVAPSNGIDAQMKRALARILDRMGVPPYRREATDEALRSLQCAAAASRTVIAAAWSADRTPRGFLDRHGSGARFALLPPPIKHAAMRHAEAWATATFGSLDAVFTECHHHELRMFHLQPGKPH
jgi:ubiquinone/menaquinone biosynthesis C-methylase UbiE